MASAHQPHHLEYFRFIGRVWGKAAFDGFLVESELVPATYKFVLGADVSLEDLREVEAAYVRSLEWMLEHDLEDADLQLTFVVEEEELGLVRQVPLKKGGEAVQVSAGNKHEYVELAARHRLIERVRPQVRHTLSFHLQPRGWCGEAVEGVHTRVACRVACASHSGARARLRLSCT